MKFEADIVLQTGTVVDFVTVKSSSFNSFQHPHNYLLVSNLKGFPDQFYGD